MAKTHGRLHKLESEGQKREIIALWAYGYSYRDICRIMHEKHGVSITHPTVVYYAHADKWAAEREKAKKRADTYRPPIDHALTRQRRREKHWHEADEAGDAEQARKLLADAGRDGTEATGAAAQATQVNTNVLLVFKDIDTEGLLKLRERLTAQLGNNGGPISSSEVD